MGRGRAAAAVKSGGVLRQHDDRMVFRHGAGQAVRRHPPVHRAAPPLPLDAQQGHPKSPRKLSG